MRILSTEEWNQLCKEMAAERDKKPVCCCSAPFLLDGIKYKPVNAGCQIHGIRSRYIPQPAGIFKAKRADTHRHTAHGVKGDS